MVSKDRDDLALLSFKTLPSDRVEAFVSTRGGGVSLEPYDSLNVGYRVDDDAEAVTENRRRLFAAASLPLERSVWCKQIHRDTVAIVGERDAGRGALSETGIVEDTDALITDVIGLPLCVTLADCVPVVIYDPEAHVVALAHAGWGGTVRRICRASVRAMIEHWNSRPEGLLAAIGPSIGPDDYEVGSDVVEQAEAGFGQTAEQFVRPRENGRWNFDLWRANALDLEDCGLTPANIEISAVSTAQHLDLFYSHRLEGTTGRFAAVASLANR